MEGFGFDYVYAVIQAAKAIAMQLTFLILAWVIVVPLTMILVYLAAELSVGLPRSTKSFPAIKADARSSVILVPAHDEAVSIENTVKALKLAAPGFRILVVADNCTDDTAELAKTNGAEVITRSDPKNIGKGFALSFGRDHLSKAPPEAVIVVDADCSLSQDSAAKLAGRAIDSGAPVQAINLQEADVKASPIVAISNFAMLVKNLIRARGLARMGGGTLLFGTGMAFPWNIFSGLQLNTSEAVEDLQLGLDLARNGIRVEFEDGARVSSPSASVNDSKGQRRRWEHGFLQSAAGNGLPLLFQGLSQRSRHLFAIGAHLLVPPLALLMLLCFGALAAVGAISFWTGQTAPFLVLSGGFLLVSILLLITWWREGRAILSAGSLLRIPFYIIWKIPIYLGFFSARQTDWNRTRRKGENP